jgi:hypothetical protein
MVKNNNVLAKKQIKTTRVRHIQNFLLVVLGWMFTVSTALMDIPRCHYWLVFA